MSKNGPLSPVEENPIHFLHLDSVFITTLHSQSGCVQNVCSNPFPIRFLDHTYYKGNTLSWSVNYLCPHQNISLTTPWGMIFLQNFPVGRLFKIPFWTFLLSLEGANNTDSGAFSLQHFVLCLILIIMFTICWAPVLAWCLTESTKVILSHTLQKAWLSLFHR